MTRDDACNCLTNCGSNHTEHTLHAASCRPCCGRCWVLLLQMSACKSFTGFCYWKH